MSGGALPLVGAPRFRATMLSLGVPNSTFGDYACADVRNGCLAVATPVQAYDCNAAQNQQFEWSGCASNSAIFASTSLFLMLERR
jgi:hypothetical protein